MSQHTIECTSPSSPLPVSRIRRAADYTAVQAERAAAQLLRASRMATGTQEDLSKASGVSRARWQSWESDEEQTTINVGRILAAAYTTQAGKAFAIDLLERLLDHVHREAGEPSGLSIERLVDVAHAEMGEAYGVGVVKLPQPAVQEADAPWVAPLETPRRTTPDPKGLHLSRYQCEKAILESLRTSPKTRADLASSIGVALSSNVMTNSMAKLARTGKIEKTEDSTPTCAIWRLAPESQP